MHPSPHIREIDALRGVAVIAMVLYHIAFDLDFFGVIDISLTEFPWNALAKIAQILFIFLSGVTFILALHKSQQLGEKHAVLRRIQQAVKLFLWAMLISIVTHLMFTGQGVQFGILHFFSVAILLSTIFIKLGKWNILLGIAIVAVGIFAPFPTDPWWLFPIGIHSTTFQSLDYFPLFPWYGLFLIGMGLTRLWLKSDYPEQYKASVRIPYLEFLGRRSLAIYLIHQPVLFGIIFLFRL